MRIAGQREMNHCLRALLVLTSTSVSIVGCAAEQGSSDPEHEAEPVASTSDELRSVVNCAARTDTAYVNASPRPISVITIGGMAVSRATGHAFLAMQHAADAAGVSLQITSGFRTMAEQQYLYHCYQTRSCNNGNLAARPGYSNHQSGLALDLTTSAWLANNAARFGFVRTVPSESWHYEHQGADPGGVCGGGAGGGADLGCHSATLGTGVPDNACVQARSDGKWYQCKDGAWVNRFSDPEACASVHPL